MTLPVLKLRTSRLHYTDCPRRVVSEIIPDEIAALGYQLRNVRRRPVVAIAVGSAVHAGDAELYRQLANTGEQGGSYRVAEAVAIAVARWRELGPEVGTVAYDGISPDQNTTERTIRRMIETYATAIDYSEVPIMVEERLQISLHGGAVVLGSTPDRVVINGKIPDIKTGDKFLPITAAQQLGGQSRVIRTHFPGLKTRLIIEHQPRRHPDKVQPPVKIEYPRQACEMQAAGAVRQILREVTEWRASVAAGRPDPEVFPTRPESYLCSEEKCQAFGTQWCSAWQIKLAMPAKKKG